eukprot:TRINITY_DN33926_c0_g1_i2.p1 TRINITY_DN33926_c0_g1~~TRINITY_DN33926_c0_g1_i2.p1  ORF type:complete len:333 (-),score=43.86 TRINITY_DN33926_c0_g1_i2:100-960(-)
MIDSRQATRPESHGDGGRSDEDLEECIAVWQSGFHGLITTETPRMLGSSASVHILGISDVPNATNGPLLKINVGGEIFRATTSTLRRAPFFDSMLRHAEAGGIGTTVDEDGHFFVDRSGELFSYILAYLQSGHWLLRDRSSDMQFVNALRDETGFYGLDPAKGGYPNPRIPEYATLWQFREDTSLYVDCLEQTIREDPAHQGLFRLCKYSGGLPLDQQTTTKRFKATSHCVQSVLAYFAMRGFGLQKVVEDDHAGEPVGAGHTGKRDGQRFGLRLLGPDAARYGTL